MLLARLRQPKLSGPARREQVSVYQIESRPSAIRTRSWLCSKNRRGIMRREQSQVIEVCDGKPPEDASSAQSHAFRLLAAERTWWSLSPYSPNESPFGTPLGQGRLAVGTPGRRVFRLEVRGKEGTGNAAYGHPGRTPGATGVERLWARGNGQRLGGGEWGRSGLIFP